MDRIAESLDSRVKRLRGKNKGNAKPQPKPILHGHPQENASEGQRNCRNDVEPEIAFPPKLPEARKSGSKSTWPTPTSLP